MIAELHLINSADEFKKLETEWNDLLSQSPSNNYFIKWEWLWHWWRIYSREGDELSIFTWRTDEALVAIAPLYIRKIRLGRLFTVRRMMFLGTQEESEGDVCSDYMDIIYRDGFERAALNSFFSFIRASDMCDEICLYRIDTGVKTFHLFQDEAQAHGLFIKIGDQSTSPFITLPKSWEDYLTALSSSKRWNLKNQRKRLQIKHNILFRNPQNPNELETDFQTFVELHQSQWKAKGLDGAFTNDHFSRFHKSLVPVMLKNGNLNLVLLYEGNQCKVADYNILYNNKLYFYQTGREISNEKIAYGNIIRYYCIEKAINDRLSEYDFLPKGRFDNYKDHFTKEYRTVCDLYLVRNRIAKQIVRTREFASSLYHLVRPVHRENSR